jgi:hypothetical protein
VTARNMRPVAAGQRFGRGVVIMPDCGRAREGSVLVRLLCDCGTRYEATRTQLWRAGKLSCGCARIHHLRKPQGESRHPRGESNPLAVLTDSNVREMRKLWDATRHLGPQDAARWSLSKLAGKYGVSKGAVGAVVQRRTWRHVT